MQANLNALLERDPKNKAISRYEVIAQILTKDQTSTAMDGIKWIFELCEQLNIPPLRIYGISEYDFPDLIEKSRVASSMKGNPIELTRKELRAILEQAF